MTREHYISFVALAAGGYGDPAQTLSGVESEDLSAANRPGNLLWYCTSTVSFTGSWSPQRLRRQRRKFRAPAAGKGGSYVTKM